MSTYKDNTRAKMLKKLEVEDIVNGYTKESDLFMCIFCGEFFEEGIIYPSRGRMVSAKRAVYEHVLDKHEGSFSRLIALDKEINGLSEVNKNLLENMFKENDNKEISKNMNIGVATVRTHKFNLQKQKREAKIFLAIMEQIENERLVEERKKSSLEASKIKKEEIKRSVSESSGNTLHPFFTQFEHR